MKFAFAVGVLAALSTPAMAGGFTMHLVPNEKQQARVEQGLEAIDSDGTTSAIRFVEPSETFKKRGLITVYFANNGDRSFTAGPENVSATAEDGTPVSIISIQQLAREEKKRQTWAAIAAGLAAAGNSMNAAYAGNTYGTATYSGNTYGNVGGYGYNSHTTGYATYSGYDATAAAIANQNANIQNERIFSNLAQRRANGEAALRSLLNTTTVDPHAALGGMITFELPSKMRSSKLPIPVTFVVEAGGERHEIKAIIQRSK